MNNAPFLSLKNRWFVGAVGIVLIIGVLAALVGFLWLPYAQNGRTVAGLWDAICRAAGAPASSDAAREPGQPIVRASEVVVSPGMLALDRLSVGRGATVAQRCTMCHGVRGMSEAATPNLAGQYPEAIYKQLRDFRSQHRTSTIMAPHVRDLRDQDMRDLAAYYASLQRVTAPNTLGQQLKAPAIVQIGAPMRNIPPCAACHGGSDLKTTSPLLDGEPASYIRDQLHAFANGTRKNDIHAQMRNVARGMTPEEIDTVARYYSRR
jgi:cytochrome c553